MSHHIAMKASSNYRLYSGVYSLVFILLCSLIACETPSPKSYDTSSQGGSHSNQDVHTGHTDVPMSGTESNSEHTETTNIPTPSEVECSNFEFPDPTTLDSSEMNGVIHPEEYTQPSATAGVEAREERHTDDPPSQGGTDQDPALPKDDAVAGSESTAGTETIGGTEAIAGAELEAGVETQAGSESVGGAEGGAGTEVTIGGEDIAGENAGSDFQVDESACTPLMPTFTPSLGNDHVISGPIYYTQIIPSSGAHRPQWAVWGEYTYLPPQRWLHNLEHGGVALLYHPCASSDDIDALRSFAQSYPEDETGPFRWILTPYSGLRTPIAVVTWEWLFELSCFDELAISQFVERFYRKAPEDIARDGGFNEGWIGR